MDQSHEDTLAAYSALLKAKLTHIAGLSGDQRVALHQQWAVLVAEVKTVLGEDPGSPRSQALLDRWIALLQALTGTDATKRMESGPNAAPFRATPELRDELWARRAEWLPADAATAGGEPTAGGDALDQARKRAERFADPTVIEFMKRAMAARG